MAVVFTYKIHSNFKGTENSNEELRCNCHIVDNEIILQKNLLKPGLLSSSAAASL